LGERLLCKQEVIGSIPFTSTIFVSNVKRKCVTVVQSAHFRLVFDQIAVSIFNNSEEAKRFNSAPGDEPGED
jgi:hypothetical protein